MYYGGCRYYGLLGVVMETTTNAKGRTMDNPTCEHCGLHLSDANCRCYDRPYDDIVGCAADYYLDSADYAEYLDQLEAAYGPQELPEDYAF
jgi:hypothetical protein